MERYEIQNIITGLTQLERGLQDKVNEVGRLIYGYQSKCPHTTEIDDETVSAFTTYGYCTICRMAKR